MINTKKFLFAKIFLSLFISISIFTPSFAVAQITQEAENIVIYPPETRINIPGVEFSEINSIRERAKARAEREQRIILEIPFLAEYISGIFNYALSAGALLAVIMIIVGGFQWAMSAGNSDAVSQAKSRITKAITGLIILLLSYSLLYAINPSLTRFKAISLVYVQPSDIDFDNIKYSTDSFGDVESFVYGEPSDLINISKISTNIKPENQKKNYRLKSNAAEALKKAAEDFSKETGSYIKLRSAYRSAAEQFQLLQHYCGCASEKDLPPNLDPTRDSWAPYCKKMQGGTCNSVAFVKRENGKFIQRMVGHLGGHAVDISDGYGSDYKLCSNMSDPKELVSQGVVKVEDDKRTIGENYCIPKGQQQLINSMLKNNFCVGLAGNSLREPWHFEYKGDGDKISAFATCNKNNEFLQKLCYIEGNTNPDCQ